LTENVRFVTPSKCCNPFPLHPWRVEVFFRAWGHKVEKLILFASLEVFDGTPAGTYRKNISCCVALCHSLLFYVMVCECAGGNGASMFFGGARWVRYHMSKLANVVFT